MIGWLEIKTLWSDYWRELSDIEFEDLQEECRDYQPELVRSALKWLKNKTEKGYRPSIDNVRRKCKEIIGEETYKFRKHDTCPWCLGYQHSAVTIYRGTRLEIDLIDKSHLFELSDGRFLVEPLEAKECGINPIKLNLPCGKCKNPFVQSAKGKDIKYWEDTYGKRFCEFTFQMAEVVYDNNLLTKPPFPMPTYKTPSEAGIKI